MIFWKRIFNLKSEVGKAEELERQKMLQSVETLGIIEGQEHEEEEQALWPAHRSGATILPAESLF